MTENEKNILTNVLSSLSLIHGNYWGEIVIVVQKGRVELVKKTETLK